MRHYAKRFFGKKIEEPRDPDFVFTINTGSKPDYAIQFRPGPKDIIIDWGNGRITGSKSDTVNYFYQDYGRPGIYQIRIKGSFQGFFTHTNYKGMKISLDQWGTNEFTTMENMFKDEINMEANYTDRPNTSNVTNMYGMFYNCSKFNGKVNFNTQNVTTMYHMFYGCSKFNQKVNFDTSNVTDMTQMFRNCREFNQEVNFDTQNVTTMDNMFRDCAEFNQKVDFNTQNVTNMRSMFNGCTKFNQKVDFNSQNVTVMSYMFKYCSALVIPVKLDTSSVTNISNMFDGGVTPQSFASWDVTSLTTGTDFITSGDMNESGNTDNYDNTLISWASQDVKRVSSISFGSSKYSSRAESARDFLVSKRWSITDGGMI